MINRRKTKKIKLGNTFIGGDSPVLVQSMLNIPAADVGHSVEQAKELAAAGCQVIRFAVPNEEALSLIEPIKTQLMFRLLQIFILITGLLWVQPNAE